MKRSVYFLVGLGLTLSLNSCQKDFLQKPETTGNTTIETVFSNKVNAEAAIAAAYRDVLAQNLWNGRSIDNGTLAGISGEFTYGETWFTIQRYVASGYLASPFANNRAQSSDNYPDNFSSIRKAFIIAENIDKVTDMDATTIGYVKAEMTALVAYRYLGMFMHYGGVPIVEKSLTPTDNLNQPRATLQQTLDYIIKLSDEAAAGLPSSWDGKYNGRFTKGAALAIKAKALIYAARPLFNSASPYLNLGANNNLISFGSADQKRWTDAITASEAVLSWAGSNGYGIINTGGTTNVPNPNALDDYGTAVSKPANKEILLAYKLNDGASKFFCFYNRTSVSPIRYLADHYAMLSNFLSNYYSADGSNITWPGLGSGNALPYSDYVNKMQNIEPRFKADNFAHGIDAWNNPGNSLWAYVNVSNGSNNPGKETYGHGVAQSGKFYYKAGSRFWFEHPLFRVPEFYLNLAEAYNETGNSAKALENLNLVHNRAGLPSITETDKIKLRAIIQREWAIEFYHESRRFFDVKHWKLENIGNGIMAGPMREFQFTLKANGNNRLASDLVNYFDQVTYTAYWHDKMFLDPFPQEEIDKGLIVQNPGY